MCSLCGGEIGPDLKLFNEKGVQVTHMSGFPAQSSLLVMQGVLHDSQWTKYMQLCVSERVAI